MDSAERTSSKLTEISKKSEVTGTKITPFSITDILTKGTGGDENQAIDMSSKCFKCETQGKLFHVYSLYKR